MKIKLNRRVCATLVGVLLALSACTSIDIREVETGLARYVRLIIPADGIQGQTYTEIGRVEFAFNSAGRHIYVTDPMTGEPAKMITGVVYSSTFSTPGELQLAGILLPGMISVGGQYAIQERCISSNGCGGGGSGSPVQILNQNNNRANGEGTATIAVPIPLPIH